MQVVSGRQVWFRSSCSSGKIRKAGLPRDVRTSNEYYQTRLKEEMTSVSNDNDGYGLSIHHVKPNP